jgi:hypothetical protein
MRFRRPVMLFLLTASLLAAPLAAQAPEPPDPPDRPRFHHDNGEPKVSIFNDIRIEKGEREGGIVCVRGDVTIEGAIDGDVVAVLGDVRVDGTINGNLVAVMGDIELGDQAVINGDLTNVGGSLDRGDAQINGSVVNVSPMGLGLPSFGWGGGHWSDWGGLFLFPWGTLLALFLFFVAALVLAALVPDRIRLISEETPVRLFTAFLFGLLGYMLLAFTLFFLCVTIIGIPIAFLVWFVFVILKWMAMCGIFHYVGTRIARSFGREFSFLGTILVGLIPFALVRLLPFCFGCTMWFLVEIVAFGLLIVTRLGTRTSAPATTPEVIFPPAPAAPPPAPPPL